MSIDLFNLTKADVVDKAIEIGGVTMVMLSGTSGEVTGGLAESVTCTLKLNVPLLPVGVPVIIPPFKLSVSGNELPVLRAHVSRPAPPVAAS
jgi:hypothetical protein